MPTEAEIKDAIQLLLRAQVLRVYDGVVTRVKDYPGNGVCDPPRHFLEDKIKRDLAHRLVDVVIGTEKGWEDRGYRSEMLCVNAFVISYVDVMRAVPTVQVQRV
jgi:hypothetical protein